MYALFVAGIPFDRDDILNSIKNGFSIMDIGSEFPSDMVEIDTYCSATEPSTGDKVELQIIEGLSEGNCSIDYSCTGHDSQV